MTEFIRLLIFIKIVIKNAIRSSIIYEGIRGVFILFFMKKFYTQKKHKMQTILGTGRKCTTSSYSI